MVLALLAVALAGLFGCSSADRAEAPSPAAVLSDGAITVGSFDFAESELLAQLYGQALEAQGLEVRYELRIGPRELAQPAFAVGLVEVLPELGVLAAMAALLVALGSWSLRRSLARAM